jgi:hypothetical protein
MTTYYEVKAVNKHDNDTEVLFGSFNKADCTSELQDEKAAWSEDYKQIKIVRNIILIKNIPLPN